MAIIIHRWFYVGLIIPLMAGADIYKTTDAEGNILYSDNKAPSESTETITPNVAPPTHMLTPPLLKPAPEKKSTPSASQKYTMIAITSPANGASIYGTAPIPLELSLTPPLQPEHKVIVSVDGRRVTEPKARTSFILDNLFRGEHTILVQILNKQGKVQIEASTIVYVFRPFIKKRAIPKPAPPHH